MIDFASITIGQWIMMWCVGLVIAHFTTAWKEEIEGLVGAVIYLVVSIFVAFGWAVCDTFMHLWNYFG